MANLTLRVDDGTLQKTREAVLHEHTCVNALVRGYLIRGVGVMSRRPVALDAVEALATRSHSL